MLSFNNFHWNAQILPSVMHGFMKKLAAVLRLALFNVHYAIQKSLFYEILQNLLGYCILSRRMSYQINMCILGKYHTNINHRIVILSIGT